MQWTRAHILTKPENSHKEVGRNWKSVFTNFFLLRLFCYFSLASFLFLFMFSKEHLWRGKKIYSLLYLYWYIYQKRFWKLCSKLIVRVFSKTFQEIWVTVPVKPKREGCNRISYSPVEARTGTDFVRIIQSVVPAFEMS